MHLSNKELHCNNKLGSLHCLKKLLELHNNNSWIWQSYYCQTLHRQLVSHPTPSQSADFICTMMFAYLMTPCDSSPSFQEYQHDYRESVSWCTSQFHQQNTNLRFSIWLYFWKFSHTSHQKTEQTSRPAMPVSDPLCHLYSTDAVSVIKTFIQCLTNLSDHLS